jgi:hypothetical protein
MKHQHGAIIGLAPKPNPTEFQKTIAVLDYYWGEPDFDYPMGAIQPGQSLCCGWLIFSI